MNDEQRAFQLGYFTEQYMHYHFALAVSDVAVKLAQQTGVHLTLTVAQYQHAIALQDATEAAGALYSYTHKQPGVAWADHRLAVDTLHEDRIWKGAGN